MTDWSQVPWTPFRSVPIPDSPANRIDRPKAVFFNSRYQVTVYSRLDQMFGPMLHLSLKTHDRAAYHDWRDLQRIKNEIAGPECDAVEVYPAESKRVDSSNQYHLFVFGTFKLPFGFQTRLVAEGSWQNSVQRPFEPDDRPADLTDLQAAVAAAFGRQLDTDG